MMFLGVLIIKERIVADKNFRDELCNLINRHSQENDSDTPDFILAEYLIDCLEAFDKATKRRTEWYEPKPDIPAFSTLTGTLG